MLFFRKLILLFKSKSKENEFNKQWSDIEDISDVEKEDYKDKFNKSLLKNNNIQRNNSVDSFHIFDYGVHDR